MADPRLQAGHRIREPGEIRTRGQTIRLIYGLGAALIESGDEVGGEVSAGRETENPDAPGVQCEARGVPAQEPHGPLRILKRNPVATSRPSFCTDTNR